MLCTCDARSCRSASAPADVRQDNVAHIRGNHLSNTASLTPVSSKVSNNVANYGDPCHDKTRIEQMRP